MMKAPDTEEIDVYKRQERCFRAVFDEHPQDELASILEGLNRLNDFLDALRAAAEKAQEEANPLTKKTDKRSS